MSDKSRAEFPTSFSSRAVKRSVGSTLSEDDSDGDCGNKRSCVGISSIGVTAATLGYNDHGMSFSTSMVAGRYIKSEAKESSALSDDDVSDDDLKHSSFSHANKDPNKYASAIIKSDVSSDVYDAYDYNVNNSTSHSDYDPSDDDKKPSFSSAGSNDASLYPGGYIKSEVESEAYNVYSSVAKKSINLSEDDISNDEKKPSFGMSSVRVSAASHGSKDVSKSLSVPTLASGFIKSDVSSNSSTMYNDVAKKLMAKMGFREGGGLGKRGQGITAPVEASKQKGRRGLGHEIKGFEPANFDWDFEKEKISAVETVEWLPTNNCDVPQIKELRSWIIESARKLTIDDETRYCSTEILNGILCSKSVFDTLEDEEMRKARTRSNPYETIRGAFFLNRAAMKMANIDASLDFMFTDPRDSQGKSIVGPNELLYFADVCAGPGGFSEYILWRKGWDAKGFGFTLRGANDFKLEDFFAAPSEFFEPHYGVGGVEGDGDVYRPDNLLEFQRFVLENTNHQGLHFMTADGGFSVEGQENIQEILSKRLYLCQFLCALMVLRPGGHFVCKLFDLFTPFSVGLVYLMYRAFNQVALFKPVTSRPANSERYIVCKGMRPDCQPIQQYMFELNERMNEIWPGISSSKVDIREIVPLEIMEGDKTFFDYVYDSNVKLGEQQIISLVKIQAFARNEELRETRQSEIRKQCLELWKVPDELRTAPDKSEKALGKFATLIKEPVTDYFYEPVTLTLALLNEKVKSIYDYRCIVTGSEQQTMLVSLGRSHVFRCDMKIQSKWLKVDDVKIELPKDTILEVEFVQELRGEGKGQRRVMAIHVIDALFLYGTDVRSFHYSERVEKAKKFVRALTRPTRSDLAPIRVKEPVRLEQIDSVFERLQMKVIKGSGHNRKLCYCCCENGERYMVPTGLLLVRTVKDPWMMAMSRSQNRKYYFDTVKRSAVYETPKDSVASYLQCLKSRLLWRWNEQAQISVDQQQAPATASGANLTKNQIVSFINEKLA